MKRKKIKQAKDYQPVIHCFYPSHNNFKALQKQFHNIFSFFLRPN